MFNRLFILVTVAFLSYETGMFSSSSQVSLSALDCRFLNELGEVLTVKIHKYALFSVSFTDYNKMR